MNRFRCEECGSYNYSDWEGAGKDDSGEFIDYWCSECDTLTRIYDEETQ